MHRKEPLLDESNESNESDESIETNELNKPQAPLSSSTMQSSSSNQPPSHPQLTALNGLSDQHRALLDELSDRTEEFLYIPEDAQLNLNQFRNVSAKNIAEYVGKLAIDVTGRKFIQYLILKGRLKKVSVSEKKKQALEALDIYRQDLFKLDQLSLNKILKVIQQMALHPKEKGAAPESHVLDHSLRYLRANTTLGFEDEPGYYHNEGLTYSSIIKFFDEACHNARLKEQKAGLYDYVNGLQVDGEVKKVILRLIDLPCKYSNCFGAYSMNKKFIGDIDQLYFIHIKHLTQPQLNQLWIHIDPEHSARNPAKKTLDLWLAYLKTEIFLPSANNTNAFGKNWKKNRSSYNLIFNRVVKQFVETSSSLPKSAKELIKQLILIGKGNKTLKAKQASALNLLAGPVFSKFDALFLQAIKLEVIKLACLPSTAGVNLNSNSFPLEHSLCYLKLKLENDTHVEDTNRKIYNRVISAFDKRIAFIEKKQKSPDFFQSTGSSSSQVTTPNHRAGSGFVLVDEDNESDERLKFASVDDDELIVRAPTPTFLPSSSVSTASNTLSSSARIYFETAMKQSIKQQGKGVEYCWASLDSKTRNLILMDAASYLHAQAVMIEGLRQIGESRDHLITREKLILREKQELALAFLRGDLAVRSIVGVEPLKFRFNKLNVACLKLMKEEVQRQAVDPNGPLRYLRELTDRNGNSQGKYDSKTNSIFQSILKVFDDVIAEMKRKKPPLARHSQFSSSSSQKESEEILIMAISEEESLPKNKN